MILGFQQLQAVAQFIINSNSRNEEVSLYSYASIADAGTQKLSFAEVKDNNVNLVFKSVAYPKSNLGFTNHHYWVKFEIVNNTNEPTIYYLETGRPVTDEVDIYILDSQGTVISQKGGDNIPFEERSLKHRKSIFKLSLLHGVKTRIFIHFKSDGEVINLPLQLHTYESLLASTYIDQLVFGIFYGILMLASIIYMFMFFALRDMSFLYYSLYVIFIALMQFSLDGYFYQYMMPDAGWFSQHSVIIFAIISGIFLGKYGETFLKVRTYRRTIYHIFRILYLLLAVLLGAIFISPSVLVYSYPIANALGLTVLVLIITSVISLYKNNIPVDRFFSIGIFFLVSGFVVFILNNFGLIPNSYLVENSPKLGTGMEIIFLSLSMAKRVRILKSEKEKMQAIALQRSEEMNEVKSFFLSNMSHELRTPLNAIMGLADLTFRESRDEKVKNNCEVIKHASYNLLSSVNDILDFSKMEKGELKLEKNSFEPLRIFEQIKNNAGVEAYEKGLDFKYSPPENMPAIIQGDATRLGQIINNVLNNAIKYTDKGFVKFEVDTLVKDTHKVSIIITISDSGIGIAKEKINTIFEPFTQETINNKRKYGGFGLGLCIVKALVDLHDGNIELSSIPNKGTLCRIILEYKLPAIQNIQAKISSSNDAYDLKGKHILIVEDNAINKLVIEAITKKWKNAVISFADNGLECLEVLKNNSVDLILMDLHMPVMDGYESTIAIRNGEAGMQNTNIPIIAITADVMESTKQKVIEIGMNDYITKPIDQEIVYDKICKLLS